MKVYWWTQVTEDIVAAQSLDKNQAEQFATDLAMAISNGEIVGRSKNGFPYATQACELSLPHIKCYVSNADVEQWLRAGIYHLYQWNPGSPKKIFSKYPSQRDFILRCIRELGHTPTQLPPFKPGIRKWVKSEVRLRALKSSHLFSEKSFEKAWEKMRRDKDIAESKV